MKIKGFKPISKKQNQRVANTSQLRIIGGTHRGRRITFPVLPGLRPTGDRMRETLFNWLQPVMFGARCLDLFAGSGALGFEAASRGANHVIMLDLADLAIKYLKENSQKLHPIQTEIIHADALQWLQQPVQPIKPFDLVFLDPPFDIDCTVAACNLLLRNRWLNDQAILYFERHINNNPLPLPDTLTLIKEQQMGWVWCGLARYNATQ